MVTLRELRRLYKKALEENKKTIIIKDELGQNEFPIHIAKKMIDELDEHNTPEDFKFGALNMSRLSPEAQASFKNVVNRIQDRISKEILEEFEEFKKGFEVEALEVEEKLPPIWKTLNIQKERAFVEALVQRTERAVDQCDCIDLVTYHDAVNQGVDAILSSAAREVRTRIKDDTIGKDEFARIAMDISTDTGRIKDRMSRTIRVFANTCTCSKNILKR